ncbi:MAG TPA: sigma 54-interacting transcriptional regulator [Kofleriaceae bacterium]|nr:sigma 54-interacting transcriptional regulator [Kofleriaceae bacterium]
MRDQLPTVADPTAAVEDDTRGRVLLAVYLGTAGEGRTRLLSLAEGDEVTFGRTRVATVPIDSERVSRLHARVICKDGRVLVEDLGSRNGTRVNGTRIEEATELSSGDQIEIGPVTAVVSKAARVARRADLGSVAALDGRLLAETDRSSRYHRSAALLMLRLEGAADAVDGAIDRVAAGLRPMDTIAEYGPDELAILVPEAAEPDAQALAARLTERARGAGADVDVRIGLAVFPLHGTQPGELVDRARGALRAARAARAALVTADPREARPPEGDVVVASPQMRRVYALVDRVADTPMTVLILGETGVGKEVVAESLHRRSGRRARPFVRLNCACLPETLLESELFGHEKGAFTGADRRKVGYFEAAVGGTIFLDEMGEISPAVQAKLLRVLEERKLTRVGGTQEIEVDVRVVCATNRDLEAEVGRRQFREDLFFRVSGFTILVPPLRDRRSEILPLADYFLGQMARELDQAAPRIAPAASRMLESHDWPGNVRELRNALERAMVLQTSGEIEVEDLPERLRDAAVAVDAPPRAPGAVPGVLDVKQQVAEVERASILAVLESCGGNQTQAARKLGLSRRALIYRMEKHGLKPPPGSA